MTTGALTKVQDDLFPAEGHKSFSSRTHTHTRALLITETWRTVELEVKLTQFGRPLVVDHSIGDGLNSAKVGNGPN